MLCAMATLTTEAPASLHFASTCAFYVSLYFRLVSGFKVTWPDAYVGHGGSQGLPGAAEKMN
jgi:hypothetical protein